MQSEDRKFKIALLQMHSEQDLYANIKQLQIMVSDAAKNGAKFVFTPENSDLMLWSKEQLQYDHLLFYNTHPFLQAAQVLAKKYSLWINLGSIRVKAKSEDRKYYNRSVTINKAGEIVASYDKIHLFACNLPSGEKYNESDRFIAGKKLSLINTDFGVMGHSICYDIRFPHLYRHLAARGAEFINIPSAFLKKTGSAHWHVLLRARAIENLLFIIAPAQTGVVKDRVSYGHSLVVNPWGEIIAESDSTSPEILYCDINLQEINDYRKRIFSYMHNPEFD